MTVTATSLLPPRASFTISASHSERLWFRAVSDSRIYSDSWFLRRKTFLLIVLPLRVLYFRFRKNFWHIISRSTWPCVSFWVSVNIISSEFANISYLLMLTLNSGSKTVPSLQEFSPFWMNTNTTSHHYISHVKRVNTRMHVLQSVDCIVLCVIQIFWLHFYHRTVIVLCLQQQVSTYVQFFQVLYGTNKEMKQPYLLLTVGAVTPILNISFLKIYIKS